MREGLFGELVSAQAIEKPLKRFDACAPRSANLNRFKPHASKAATSPAIHRGDVSWFSSPAPRQLLRGLGERQCSLARNIDHLCTPIQGHVPRRVT